MTHYIKEEPVAGWEDISRQLTLLKSRSFEPLPASKQVYLKALCEGTAFLTFAYGIDGVSIDIAKYARALGTIYRPYGDPALHFIAGDFSPRADAILKPGWSRFRIEGINGWSKWDEGKWFSALYFEDMPAGSRRSSDLAKEIYRQALSIAGQLGDYLLANKISLLIPVNVASNPGNLALTLALVLITEALGIMVINSNHDYYWDGGKPAGKRKPGEVRGERDHFFHNAENHAFFSLFQMLYPWSGRRWLQLNINKGQSRRIVKDFGFPGNRVYEIPTCVGNKLFDDYTAEDVRYARLRMANILSHGGAQIQARSLVEHQRDLPEWMLAQSPQIIGIGDGLSLDLLAHDIIYLLQPTRVVARKRIEKGVELIQALLEGPLKDAFERNPNRQLVLHITGPTPLEHQRDLERILDAYQLLSESLPTSVAERVFLAFSSGHETNPTFEERSLTDMNIVDIYRLATAVLFPSETEGRGLPIIESGAVGVPIICSRYQPEEVFAEVIGEDLPEEQRIHYLLFPEEEFSKEFLEDAGELLTRPDSWTDWCAHNRRVIRSRYSVATLTDAFSHLLDKSYEMLAR